MQRAFDGGAGGDMDHGAVAHQRGVERDRDIGRGRELAEFLRERWIAGGERIGERHH